MLCDHCHKNEATIHMTNIVNNQKTEQHLCGTCATELQQEGKLSPYSSFMNDMWDNSFFTNDFFKNMVYPDNLLKSHQSKRCPQCGITSVSYTHLIDSNLSLVKVLNWKFNSLLLVLVMQ